MDVCLKLLSIRIRTESWVNSTYKLIPACLEFKQNLPETHLHLFCSNLFQALVTTLGNHIHIGLSSRLCGYHHTPCTRATPKCPGAMVATTGGEQQLSRRHLLTVSFAFVALYKTGTRMGFSITHACRFRYLWIHFRVLGLRHWRASDLCCLQAPLP